MVPMVQVPDFVGAENGGELGVPPHDAQKTTRLPAVTVFVTLEA